MAFTSAACRGDSPLPRGIGQIHMITRPQTAHNFLKRVKKNGEKSHLPSSSKRLTIKSFFGINQFHDRHCPKNRVLWRKNKKKSMKMWREFVTRGFQIAQLEERISLLINIFAFLKTWRARYLYYLARYVFGFLISLFSMQIRSSNWP